MATLTIVANAAENFESMSRSQEIALEINQCFARGEQNLRAAQGLMLELLRQLQYCNGKEIKDNPDVVSIFSGTSFGAARARLVAWIEEYTPIRARYERDKEGKKTGKIIGCKLNIKNPDWRLDEAEKVFFMDASDKRASKGLSSPNIQNALKNVFKMIARAVDTGECSIEDAREMVSRAAGPDFAANLLAAMASEHHQAWVDAYSAQKAEAERVVGSKAA